MARAKALWLLPLHNFEGKYIYTYRDPRDAILSLYEMYRHRKGRQDLTPEQFLKEYDPIGQYQWEIRAWVISKHDNVLLVKLEHLKQSPIPQFQRIFQFLEIEDNVKEDVIAEPVAIVDSSSHRPRRTVYGWKIAPPEYGSAIQSISSALDAEIRALSYDPL